MPPSPRSLAGLHALWRMVECPDGACPRTQPAYLFSGEFHETVVDLRIAACTVGLDLVWARRYRSRLPLPSTPLGNRWDHSYNIYLDIPERPAERSPITVYDGNARPQTFRRDAQGLWTAPRYHRSGEFVQNFAQMNPTRASWNANNYEEYAEDR